MPRQVLIIHGWSDTSKSFVALGQFLSANGYQPKLICSSVPTSLAEFRLS